jgi:2-oxo-hept-3-ene-1,7-dioate hydratase
MSMSADQIDAEAVLLDTAEQTRVQCRQTTSVHADITMDEAYAVQAAWRDLKVGRGERIVGHKIGLTSRAMQEAMKITTPDSGFLTDAMMFESGAELESAAYLDGRIEVELAFVLAHDLGAADTSLEDVLAATDHVVPALELIAARTPRVDAAGRTRNVFDTIADNAANGAVITGGRAVGATEVDLRWVGAILYRNGVPEETGLAAGVLDHPANGIAWLARRYSEQGLRLEAGHVVLAGSFTRPVLIRPGDEFTADYGPLGTINVSFPS